MSRVSPALVLLSVGARVQGSLPLSLYKVMSPRRGANRLLDKNLDCGGESWYIVSSTIKVINVLFQPRYILYIHTHTHTGF